MRSQAPYKKRFSDRFRQNDEYVRYLLRTVIDQGIEEGVFAAVASDHVSRALVTIVDGARTRAVVLDEERSLTTVRRITDEYVQAVLLSSPTDRAAR